MGRLMVAEMKMMTERQIEDHLGWDERGKNDDMREGGKVKVCH